MRGGTLMAVGGSGSLLRAASSTPDPKSLSNCTAGVNPRQGVLQESAAGIIGHRSPYAASFFASSTAFRFRCRRYGRGRSRRSVPSDRGAGRAWLASERPSDVPSRRFPRNVDLTRTASPRRKRSAWRSGITPHCGRRLPILAPLLSSKGIGDSGINTGPGLSMEIPLFDRGQGRISRAEAELEQAALQLAALRAQVESETAAAARLSRVEASLQRLQRELIPLAGGLLLCCAE